MFHCILVVVFQEVLCVLYLGLPVGHVISSSGVDANECYFGRLFPHLKKEINC